MRAVNPKNHKNLIKTTLKWRVLANLELNRKVRVGSDEVFIEFHKNRQNLDRTKMSIYSTITIVNFYTKKLFNYGMKVNRSLNHQSNRWLSQQNLNGYCCGRQLTNWLFLNIIKLFRNIVNNVEFMRTTNNQLSLN
mgnify:CR=1 FL=1